MITVKSFFTLVAISISCLTTSCTYTVKPGVKLKQPELYTVATNITEPLNNNVKLIDNRTFIEEGNSHDLSQPIIAIYHADTKAQRLISIGYARAVDTEQNFNNIVVDKPINIILAKYLEDALNATNNKSYKSADVSIQKMWISFHSKSYQKEHTRSAKATTALAGLALETYVNVLYSSRDLSFGYDYDIDFSVKLDENTTKDFVCRDVVFNASDWSISKEKILKTSQNMLSDIKSCIDQNMK